MQMNQRSGSRNSQSLYRPDEEKSPAAGNSVAKDNILGMSRCIVSLHAVIDRVELVVWLFYGFLRGLRGG
jgi:hypothetical protein